MTSWAFNCRFVLALVRLLDSSMDGEQYVLRSPAPVLGSIPVAALAFFASVAFVWISSVRLDLCDLGLTIVIFIFGQMGPTKHRKELQGTTRNYKVLLNLQNA